MLHVIAGIDFALGGPPVALKGLAESQSKLGMTVTVMSTWAESQRTDLADQLRELGVRVELVGPVRTSLQLHPLIEPTLQRLIAQSDIVHVHTIWEQPQHKAARIAYGQSVPYIIRPAGMLDPYSLTRRSSWKKRLYMAWRLRTNLNRAAAVHFTSELERDLVRPLALGSTELVVPNGIDLHEFEQLPLPGSFRDRFPEVGDRRIVLFLSRIHPKKGLDLLVPAFARGAPKDAVLVIVGPDDGGYRSVVESDIAAQGLSDRVVFTGMLRGSDRIAPMVDAELFVLPSYQENFGIAVVEALAAGTPVIISDQINIWKEIESEAVGAVVPTSVQPLSEALEQWLEDDHLRISAAARCQAFVRQRYDWKQIAQQWCQHYAELIS